MIKSMVFAKQDKMFIYNIYFLRDVGINFVIKKNLRFLTCGYINVLYAPIHSL